MVPHCSGYVLKLEMSWTQLRKPTKVIDSSQHFSLQPIQNLNIYLKTIQTSDSKFTTVGCMCRGYHMHILGTQGYYSWGKTCHGFGDIRRWQESEAVGSSKVAIFVGSRIHVVPWWHEAYLNGTTCEEKNSNRFCFESQVGIKWRVV
jgi:hypothetical protein